MKSFINKLLLNYFPKLVVLQVGSGSTFDSHEKRADRLAVKSG
jgi:hypothetical protein